MQKLTNGILIILTAMTLMLAAYRPWNAVLWAVSVGGTHIGYVEDPSAIGELFETALASKSSYDTVYATFADKVTVTEAFAPGSTADDPMEVSRRLREVTEVITVRAIN